MSGVVGVIPRYKFTSALGVPLAAGTLTVYEAGTTTLADTWQDEAQTILNTNPIVLNAAGETTVYLDSSKSYKWLLKNALGATQWTEDNISGADSGLRAALAAPGGSALLGFRQAGAGAAPRTLEAKVREIVSVTDFYANGVSGALVVGNGVTDCTGGIKAALTTGRSVFFPPGVYCISDTLLIDHSYQRVEGQCLGNYYSAATGGGVDLKWIGAAGGTMMRVPTGTMGPQVFDIAFNANNLANHCLHLDVRAGSSIQSPSIGRLAFRGYCDAALILGENERTASRNGALQGLEATHLIWWGGGASAVDPTKVCGLLLNAQNCEWLAATYWYLDPFTSVGGGPYVNHYNHIVGVSGGIQLRSLLSTRATLHAIQVVGDAQIVVDGWRSEDVYLLNYPSSSTITAPVALRDVWHRAGNATGKDEVITIRPSGNAPVTIENSYVKGLIGVGTSVANQMNVRGVVFHTVRSGTCQAGSTSTTIVLDAGASADDDYYNNCEILVTGGAGAGQSFLIGDYVGATKTVTITGYGDVGSLFPVPDATSTFLIRGAVRNYSGASDRTAYFESHPGHRRTYSYAPQEIHYDSSGNVVSAMRNGSLRVRGIGGSGYPRNLGGGFQHVDADGVSKTVTFVRAEGDAAYRVQMVPESFTGTPAAGSEIYKIVKATSGFTVTFNAGVGAGNTRTWTWMIFRD